MTDARLPDPAVVVLAGAAGSGKSTWAAERFRAAEIVSSDALRAAVAGGAVRREEHIAVGNRDRKSVV